MNNIPYIYTLILQSYTKTEIKNIYTKASIDGELRFSLKMFDTSFGNIRPSARYYYYYLQFAVVKCSGRKRPYGMGTRKTRALNSSEQYIFLPIFVRTCRDENIQNSTRGAGSMYTTVSTIIINRCTYILHRRCSERRQKIELETLNWNTIMSLIIFFFLTSFRANLFWNIYSNTYKLQLELKTKNLHPKKILIILKIIPNRQFIRSFFDHYHGNIHVNV